MTFSGGYIVFVDIPHPCYSIQGIGIVLGIYNMIHCIYVAKTILQFDLE